MYHPLTPGQSWVQSPVSFRRRGVGGGERERDIAGDCETWTDTEVGIGGDVGKNFKEVK